MNFLTGLIGATASAASDKWQLDDQEARKERYRQADSDLRIKEQQTIEALRPNYATVTAERADAAKIAAEQRATAAKNKPQNDFAAGVAQHLNDEVPASAPPPVTKLNGLVSAGDITGNDGQPLQMQGGGDRGLVGKIADLKNQITNSAMSDEDKQGALDQIDAQAGHENAVNAAMTPPTRPMTQPEAVDAAIADAFKSLNGPAAAAGQEFKDYGHKDRRLGQQDRLVGASESRVQASQYLGGREPAFVASYKFLESKGYSPDQIEKLLTEKKSMSAADLAAKLAGKSKKPPGKVLLYKPQTKEEAIAAANEMEKRTEERHQ